MRNVIPYSGIPLSIFLEYAPIDQIEDAELPRSNKNLTSIEDFPDDTPLWNMCHGDDIHEHMEDDNDDSWLEELPDDNTPEDKVEKFTDFLPPDEPDEADTWLEAAEAELEKLEKEVACFEVDETIPTGISFINIEPMTPRSVYLRMEVDKRSRHGSKNPHYKTWDRRSYQRFQKQFGD